MCYHLRSPALLPLFLPVFLVGCGKPAEALLVDALRDGGYVRVSLVAEQAGQVVGHILFSDLPIITEGGTVPALALAPKEMGMQTDRSLTLQRSIGQNDERIAKGE